MRKVNGPIFLLLGLIVAAGMATSVYSAEISWSNASGGNWSTASNWTGDVVPGPDDTAFITLEGTYTVTLDADTTVEGLIIGGASGRQTLSMSSRTLTVNGPFNINSNGKVGATYSTIGGTGTLLVTDTLALNGSAIDVPLHNSGVITAVVTNSFNQGYTNDPGSTLRLWYSSNWGAVINFSGGFTNNGTIEMVNTYSTANTRLNSPGTIITNSATGTIHATGTTGSCYITAQLDNQGTIDIDHYLQLNDASVQHTNSGTISLTDGGYFILTQSGTAPSFTNTGTITIADGCTFDINDGAFDYPSGSITGGGTLDFNDVDIAWVPKMNWAGPLVLYYSTLTLSDSLIIDEPTPVTGSIIDGTGSLLVTDTLALNGSIIDVPLHNSGVITAIVGNSFNQGYTNDPGSILHLWYTSNVGAYVELTSGFTNNGTIEMVNTYSTANTRIYSPGNIVTNSATGTIHTTGTTGGCYITAQLENQGTIDIDHYLQLNDASVQHTNSGTINLTDDGSLVLNQSGTAPGFTNTGIITLENGCMIDVNNGSFNNQVGGILAGNGLIDLTGSVTDFTNAGTINPGLSPGALTISGMDMTQQSTSLINIEVESATSGDFDSLAIVGNVTKGGILNVDLYNGYFPTIGDSIPFLSATAVSGDFDSLDLQIGGIVFDTVSSADLISLVCTQADNLDPTIALDATQDFDAGDSVQIDLIGSSDDPEYPDSMLTFGYTADNDSLLVTIDTANGIITLKSDIDYSGTVELIVTVSDPGGASGSDTVTVTISPFVSVDENGEATLPTRFALAQNYPNPFNPVTTMEYSVPFRSHVTIEVFDILGRNIVTLVDEIKSAGEYQATWDGNDANNQKVSTGIYLYRLQAGDFIETKKMLLLK
jgi:hypothetical protein